MSWKNGVTGKDCNTHARRVSLHRGDGTLLQSLQSCRILQGIAVLMNLRFPKCVNTGEEAIAY